MTFPRIRGCVLLATLGCFLATSDCSAKDEKVAGSKPARSDLYGDPLPEGAIARLGTVRWRHNSQVCSLCFSPDGRMIASLCHDRQVHFWDVVTGKETRRLGEQATLHWLGNEQFISYAPDGKTVVVAGWPNQGLEAWNLATGTKSVLGGDVQSLFAGFSPDGKLLAEKTDGFLRLWDLSSGKIVGRLKDKQTPISPPAYGLAFSPDSKIVASAGTDPVIRLWDISTGNRLRQLTGHKDKVAALAFSPDGKILVSAAWDSTIRAWDVNTGTEIRQFKGHEGRVYSAVISPDGKTICSGAEDHTVRLWEMVTGRELKRFSLYSPNLLPVTFSPDGKLVAAGGGDHIIHLWNPSTGKEEGFAKDQVPSIGWLAFLPGRKSLISKSGREGKFKFWNPLTGQEKKDESQLGEPQDWTISQHGKTLAVLGSSLPKKPDESIHLWDLETNREIKQFEPAVNRVNSLGLSADGALLAVGGEDSSVQIWNVSTSKEVRTLGQNLGMDDKWRLDSLTISPDGAILVAKRIYTGPGVIIGINPRTPSEMYFFDLSSGKKLERFENFKKWCDWVVFSPDSKTMVSTAQYSHYHLCFWEVATGKGLRTVENNKRFLVATFSPDGRTLATGIEDGTVLLWEVITGKIRRSLKGHRGPVHHLAFSDDSLLLASESSDGTALVWDLYNQFSK